MSHRGIRVPDEQLSEFERGRIIVGQIGESLVMWVEAMRPLEEDGSGMTDFAVMMVAVDLRPQQMWRID
ncbi:hypothetical protein TNCV_269831 [Trichonephila clavipes]|nr:hypothetical protein TNCV_269831 [Trichonephila clavipes]